MKFGARLLVDDRHGRASLDQPQLFDGDTRRAFVFDPIADHFSIVERIRDLPYLYIVHVQHGDAAGRQAVDDLPLCPSHAFDRSESFKVRGTDGCEHADPRRNERTELGDVPGLASAHLDHEVPVPRSEFLVDRARYTKCGVERAWRCEHL
jgi:hypothetical protein